MDVGWLAEEMGEACRLVDDDGDDYHDDVDSDSDD